MGVVITGTVATIKITLFVLYTARLLRGVMCPRKESHQCGQGNLKTPIDYAVIAFNATNKIA